LSHWCLYQTKKVGGCLTGLSAGHPRDVKPIEALARIFEVETLRDHIFAAQPVDRVAHGPRRKIRPLNNFLLRQQPAGLEDFEDELRRRRKVLEFRRIV